LETRIGAVASTAVQQFYVVDGWVTIYNYYLVCSNVSVKNTKGPYNNVVFVWTYPDGLFEG